MESLKLEFAGNPFRQDGNSLSFSFLRFADNGWSALKHLDVHVTENLKADLDSLAFSLKFFPLLETFSLEVNQMTGGESSLE